VKIHLAIFASGSGTNANAIMHYFESHPEIRVALVVTNKPQAGVIEVAKKWNVPSLIITNKQLQDEEFLIGELKKHNVNWIILAGFMVMIPPFLVCEYANKMINIHPALLPKFGGKGMYGRNVHEAVIKTGEKKSGITIHFVNEKYDEGKIIFQAETLIEPKDTVESLEQRIHKLEHANYPAVIEKLVL
jgi:phosphoribosylglycinamide formyltransferase-1